MVGTQGTIIKRLYINTKKSPSKSVKMLARYGYYPITRHSRVIWVVGNSSRDSCVLGAAWRTETLGVMREALNKERKVNHTESMPRGKHVAYPSHEHTKCDGRSSDSNNESFICRV